MEKKWLVPIPSLSILLFPFQVYAAETHLVPVVRSIGMNSGTANVYFPITLGNISFSGEHTVKWLAILAALAFFLLSMNLLRLNRQRRLAAAIMLEDKRFQQMIADIASHFINVSADDTDQVVHNAIQKCGTFFNVDRSYLIRFSDDHRTRIHQYEWCAEGIEPLWIKSGEMTVDHFPWLYNQILSGRSVHVPDVSGMPPEAAKDQAFLLQHQVKALFLLPITVNNQVMACWGFEELNKAQHWEEKHVALLQVLTALFENAYEKHSAERRRKSWQDLMQYVIQHDPNGVVVLDKELRILFVSQRFLVGYNATSDEVIGQPYYEVFADIPEKWRQVHRRILDGSVETSEDDWFERTDGSVHYLRWEARPWHLEDGEIGGIVIYTEMINDRKKKELALQESEERFRMLVETAPDAIFLYTDRKLAYANKTAVRLLGAEDAEAIMNLPVASHLHPDYHKLVEKRDHQLLHAKQAVPPMEQTYVRLDGSLVDVEVTSAPIRYENKDGMLVYVRNIADRKMRERETMSALQEQRHHQKLEAIGLLASGVAHEINNPLTGIINYAQLIIDQENSEAESAHYADEIITESRRISGIVRDLLHFSRQEKHTHSPANIGDIIRRTLSLVNLMMKRDLIDIRIDIPEDLPMVQCRSQQIQQVIMNLLTNARDALNDRFPEADADKVLQISCTAFKEKAQTWVRVSVEDRGFGIPEEIHERIFDPFFTTKPKELGTGLGLPISYGIVKEHHGDLIFETEQGKRTRFHLLLPADDSWAPALQQTS